MSKPEEGVRPTPEQWVEMFLEAGDAKRLVMAERVIENADASLRCFIENHDGLKAEVEHAWARGYLEACQRIKDSLQAEGDQ